MSKVASIQLYFAFLVFHSIEQRPASGYGYYRSDIPMEYLIGGGPWLFS
jgi:hypothetical protein